MSSASERKAVNAAAESRYWEVDEQDGAVVIVRRAGLDLLVMVEHDGKQWVCSECGEQGGTTGYAPLTCAHTMAATKNLSRELAAQIASRIAKPFRAQKATPVQVATAASSLATGAEKRAERARRHDATHQRVTSEVVVRPMTDEDRRRLVERRRHRRIGE